MQEFSTFFQGSKPKLPFHWPGTLNLASLNPIPHKYRPSNSSRRRSSEKRRDEYPNAAEDITRLQTSFNPWHGFRELRRHRWTVLDLQYVVLAGLLIFSLAIAPPAPVAKGLAAVGTLLVLFMPVTRQFFLPSLPIWTYLVYFFCSR
jgi:inositol phosphorylceramide synthase catalytic subunit